MDKYNINDLNLNGLTIKDKENNQKINYEKSTEDKKDCICQAKIICNICTEFSEKLHKYLTDQKIPYKDINLVAPKIYLGNESASKSIKLLNDLQIKDILVCGGKLKKNFPTKFNYYQLPIKDSKKTENISQYFKITNGFIDKSEKVFIHCQRGVSRSGTIIVAYFMWKNNWSLEEALQYVQTKRKAVLPRENFIDELKVYEKSLKLTSTSSIQK